MAVNSRGIRDKHSQPKTTIAYTRPGLDSDSKALNPGSKE
jgi:hypothetical protein